MFFPTNHFSHPNGEVNGETYLRSTHIGKLFTGRPASYYFNQWKTDGTLERINRALNRADRMREKREASPPVFYIDSQSGPPCGVKPSPMICEYRGIDGYKKVNAGPLWAASAQGFVPVAKRWLGRPSGGRTKHCLDKSKGRPRFLGESSKIMNVPYLLRWDGYF